MPKIVMLPGLDGGGELLGDVTQQLVILTGRAVEVHCYPNTTPLGYVELEAQLRHQLPLNSPYVLVAESFSGPLAIRLAACPPAGLQGVVLVATFARAPVWSGLLPLVRPSLFRWPPPNWAIRSLLLGPGADGRLVDAVKRAIALNPPEILAHRVRETLNIDVSELARAIELPVFCLTPSEDRLVRSPLRPEPLWGRQTVMGPHLLMQRQPHRCAIKIAEFIEELDVAVAFG